MASLIILIGGKKRRWGREKEEGKWKFKFQLIVYALLHSSSNHYKMVAIPNLPRGGIEVFVE